MAGVHGTEVLYKKESHLGMTTLTFRSKRYTFPSVIVKSDLKSEGMCVMLDVGMFCPFCTGTYRAKLVSSRARLAITKSSSYEEAMKRLEHMGSEESCDSHTYSSCDSHSTSGSSPRQCSNGWSNGRQSNRAPDRDTFEENVATFESTLKDMQNSENGHCPTSDRTNMASQRQNSQKGAFGNGPQFEDSEGKRALFVETKEAQLSFRHDKISKCGDTQQKQTFQLPQNISSKDKTSKTLLYRDPHIPAPELLLRAKLCEQGKMPGEEKMDSPVVPKKHKPQSPEKETAKQDTKIITEVKLNNQKSVAEISGDNAFSDEDITLELKHITNLDKGMCTTRAIKSVPIELFVSDEHSLSSSPVVEGSIMSDYGSWDIMSRDVSHTSLGNISSAEDIHNRYRFMEKSVHGKPRATDKIIGVEDRTKHGSLETLKPIQTKADESSWSSEDLRGFKMEVHHPISLHRYAGRPFKPKKKKVPTATLR